MLYLILLAVIAGLMIWAAIQRAQYRNALRDAFVQMSTVFQDAVKALPVGVLYCDSDDKIVLWNDLYADFAGPSRSILQPGLAFRDLLVDVTRHGSSSEESRREPDWIETRMAARAAGQNYWESQLPDGRWLRLENRKTGSGGFVQVAVDITDAKRREASLRLLFDTNPIPMWIWDPDALVFTDSNKAAQDHFGWSAEAFRGMSVLDTLPEPEQVALKSAFPNGVPEKYVVSRPWRHLKADGSEILIVSQGARLPGDSPRLLLSALLDVTEQVRTEARLKSQKAALREAMAAAETANRAKSEFLANMSHEIRTPLNGVVAVADVLSRTELSKGQAEMVELIRSSGESLNRLLSDILDLARIESGRLTIETQAFHLGRALRDVAGLSSLKAHEKGLAFWTDISPEADRTVLGDTVRVKQIVSNLLSNAVKFTAHGSVRLIASFAQSCGTVEIRVEDTGEGFDEVTKAKLFHRFQQADGSITRRFGGSGLGLSICRELAELMDGEIDCESRPGEGSVFTLRLKLEQVLETAQDEPGASEAVVRPLRILLADDHPTNQRVACMVLSQCNADVTVVENGEQAVQAFRAAAFDLVLMDMHMPVRDGLSATRMIRTYETETGAKRTPVIMLTANAGAEHAAASASAGAEMHLAKPFTAVELLTAVSSLIEDPDLTIKVA